MDVGQRIRSIWAMLLVVGLLIVTAGRAQADPVYTAIDLGVGNVSYGADSSGNGTVTGSNGLTYVFNPVQNAMTAQGISPTQGVPTPEPAPVWSPDTHGNPAFAYSNSTLNQMNSQGLAAGIDYYGVSGHLGNGQAFLTQRQPDGTWGPPVMLWSGTENFGGMGGYGLGIWGVASNGQVLGYGAEDIYGRSVSVLYLYDSKTQTLTNMDSLINSMKWTNAPSVSMTQGTNTWVTGNLAAQFDEQGRFLIQASQGTPSGTPHELLLVPEGVSADPVATPEPATWAIFAALIGGWMARQQLRRSGPESRSGFPA